MCAQELCRRDVERVGIDYFGGCVYCEARGDEGLVGWIDARARDVSEVGGFGALCLNAA